MANIKSSTAPDKLLKCGTFHILIWIADLRFGFVRYLRFEKCGTFHNVRTGSGSDWVKC